MLAQIPQFTILRWAEIGIGRGAGVLAMAVLYSQERKNTVDNL